MNDNMNSYRSLKPYNPAGGPSLRRNMPPLPPMGDKYRPYSETYDSYPPPLSSNMATPALNMEPSSSAYQSYQLSSPKLNDNIIHNNPMLSRKRAMETCNFGSYETSLYPDAIKKQSIGNPEPYHHRVGYSSEYKSKESAPIGYQPSLSSMPILPPSAPSSTPSCINTLEKYFTAGEIKKFNEYKRFLMMTSPQGQKKFFMGLEPAEYKRFNDFMDMDKPGAAYAVVEPPARIVKPPPIHHTPMEKPPMSSYSSYQYEPSPSSRYYADNPPMPGMQEFSQAQGQRKYPVAEMPPRPVSSYYDSIYNMGPGYDNNSDNSIYNTSSHAGGYDHPSNYQTRISSSFGQYHRDSLSPDRSDHRRRSRSKHRTSQRDSKSPRRLNLPTQNREYLTKEMRYFMQKYKNKLAEKSQCEAMEDGEEKEKKLKAIRATLFDVKKKILNFRKDLERLPGGLKQANLLDDSSSRSSKDHKSGESKRQASTDRSAKAAAAASDAKKTKPADVKKTSSRQVKKINSTETKKPSSAEAKKTSSTEAKKPSSEEVKKPKEKVADKKDKNKDKKVDPKTPVSSKTHKSEPSSSSSPHKKEKSNSHVCLHQQHQQQRNPLYVTSEEFDANLLHYQWCHMCDLFFDSPIQFLTHLHREAHVEKLHASDYSILRQAEYNYNQSFHEDNHLHSKQAEDGEQSTMEIIGSEFLYPSKSYYCDLCTKFLLTLEEAKHHLKSAKHVNAYKKYLAKNKDYAEEITQERTNSMRRSRFIIHTLMHRKSKGENILEKPKPKETVNLERQVRHCVDDLLDQVVKRVQLQPANKVAANNHKKIDNANVNKAKASPAQTNLTKPSPAKTSQGKAEPNVVDKTQKPVVAQGEVTKKATIVNKPEANTNGKKVTKAKVTNNKNKGQSKTNAKKPARAVAFKEDVEDDEVEIIEDDDAKPIQEVSMQASAKIANGKASQKGSAKQKEPATKKAPVRKAKPKPAPKAKVTQKRVNTRSNKKAAAVVVDDEETEEEVEVDDAAQENFNDEDVELYDVVDQ